MSDWLVLVKAYSMAYKVDPYKMLALAKGEGCDRKGNLRFGRYGKYYLPFGIYTGCHVARAGTPGGNAEAGIRAIAKHIHKTNGDFRAALRLYNTGDRGKKFEGYYRNIKRLEKESRMAGVFE